MSRPHPSQGSGGSFILGHGFHSAIAEFKSDIRTPVNTQGQPRGFFEQHAEADTESRKEEIGEHWQAIIEPSDRIQHIDLFWQDVDGDFGVDLIKTIIKTAGIIMNS